MILCKSFSIFLFVIFPFFILPAERCKGTHAKQWNGCCTSKTPCSYNDGDCDSNSDCYAGLKCGTNNCIGSGWQKWADCCTLGKYIYSKKLDFLQNYIPVVLTISEVVNFIVIFCKIPRMDLYDMDGDYHLTLDILCETPLIEIYLALPML